MHLINNLIHKQTKNEMHYQFFFFFPKHLSLKDGKKIGKDAFQNSNKSFQKKMSKHRTWSFDLTCVKKKKADIKISKDGNTSVFMFWQENGEKLKEMHKIMESDLFFILSYPPHHFLSYFWIFCPSDMMELC